MKSNLVTPTGCHSNEKYDEDNSYERIFTAKKQHFDETLDFHKNIYNFGTKYSVGHMIAQNADWICLSSVLVTSRPDFFTITAAFPWRL